MNGEEVEMRGGLKASPGLVSTCFRCTIHQGNKKQCSLSEKKYYPKKTFLDLFSFRRMHILKVISVT